MTNPTLNDRSSPLSLLLTRRSVPSRTLVAPGPDAIQQQAILAAACRVPDHGKLAPWRFVIITDRDAFTALLHRHLHDNQPDAGPDLAARLADFAHRAPLLIAVISTASDDGRIPVQEQWLSAGAACQNLLLAAHAHGYGANWLTGTAAYLPGVAEALGVPGGKIAGFVFIGTPARLPEERPRPTAADVTRRWPA